MDFMMQWLRRVELAFETMTQTGIIEESAYTITS
jgi:hypothetical protein